jgi:ribosome-associated protein
MNEFDDPNHDEDDIEWVSKSEMKREMHQLQEMGEQLLKVKKTELAKFPLSDVMVAAIEESSRIKSHEAMRRHLQYIGKLMRNEEIDEIQACLDKLDPSSDLFLRIHGQAEAWREKLIRKSNAESEWFELYPETDRQPFRALVRAAKKEQSEDAAAPILAGKNGKKLLQWIRGQLLE